MKKSGISSEYKYFGIPDKDLCIPSNRKVGKGGVAIMWRSELSNHISVLDIDSDRICGIQYMLCTNVRVYFLQVYAPCASYSIALYREFVDYLQSLISLYSDNGMVVVMGDFNTHLQGQRYIKSPTTGVNTCSQCYVFTILYLPIHYQFVPDLHLPLSATVTVTNL